MQTLQSSLVWTTTSCIAVKQARRSREILTSGMHMSDPNRPRVPPPASPPATSCHPPPYPLQALADLLYHLLAALALALRARIVSLLVAAAEWCDDDDSNSRKHQRHSKARRCWLSPPPCDSDITAPGYCWRAAVLLPPQARHLSGRLTVSRHESF